MGDTVEILLTTDSSPNLGSACAWNHKAGTCVHNYKSGGIITSNTIAFIRDDYFIAAERLKPLIHVWKINSQETTKQMKIVTPGPVTSLAVSPDGNYCVAGIAEHLYVWHITTGNLLANVGKHFQNIIKVIFSKDGSYVVSAAEDGIVFIWRLNQLVSQMHSIQSEPVYSLTDHTLPIRDMCISSSAKNAYLMTVSCDCSLKINQVDSGDLLLSVVFDVSLTAVACNTLGTQVYIGTTNGNIYEISLVNPPRNRSYHELSNDKVNLFSGHTKNITALTVSADGVSLASGAADSQVIIWHIPTKQKLKTISHNGTITNVLFMMVMKNMFAEEFKPSTVLNSFKRDLTTEENNRQVIEVIHSEDINLPFEDGRKNIVQESTPTAMSNDSSLQSEIDRLKQINSKLYQFSVECILEQKHKNNSNGVSEPKDETLPSLKPSPKKRKH